MSKTTNFQTPNTINTICDGTQIVGDINTKGEIRIDGSLEGNLKATGKVVIGNTGKIKGQIVCKNCDVQGVVDGKIEVEQLLSLKRTSSIKGDIITNQLGIEPGAIFIGTCSMKENEIQKDKKK